MQIYFKNLVKYTNMRYPGCRLADQLEDIRCYRRPQPTPTISSHQLVGLMFRLNMHKSQLQNIWAMKHSFSYLSCCFKLHYYEGLLVIPILIKHTLTKESVLRRIICTIIDDIFTFFMLYNVIRGCYDCRVHCQLVKLFARGIEPTITHLEQCASNCISCAGVL